MLAYVFWHWPRAGTARAAYETAQLEFQRSLARRPPAGMRASASLRLNGLPWDEGGGGDVYEDWYVLEDWTAVGVLEQAAVGAGHRSRHDRAAGLAGGGAGAVYRLAEGDGLAALAAPCATWVQACGELSGPSPAELLADGAPSSATALWRRALALGPAPEWCLLADESPAGARPSRLPAGWGARAVERALLFGGG